MDKQNLMLIDFMFDCDTSHCHIVVMFCTLLCNAPSPLVDLRLPNELVMMCNYLSISGIGEIIYPPLAVW